MVPPSCQHANVVGEGVRLGGTEVITFSVGGVPVGEIVGVKVRMIVGDCVGVGVPLGSAEAGVVAVGMACVSVSTNFNEVSNTFSGEVCGLHAPSMRTMIRKMKMIHVRFNKSPVLLWLALPVCGLPVYQKKPYVV